MARLEVAPQPPRPARLVDEDEVVGGEELRAIVEDVRRSGEKAAPDERPDFLRAVGAACAELRSRSWAERTAQTVRQSPNYGRGRQDRLVASGARELD